MNEGFILVAVTECPQCETENLYIHYETFGMDRRQVQPARCELCRWTEKDNEDVLEIKPLCPHEIDYIVSHA